MAYHLVKKKGIQYLTARNLSVIIGMSTQPIYIQFKNMGELRKLVIEQIYDKLHEYKTGSSNNIINYVVSYITLSRKAPNLYAALWSDSKLDNKITSLLSRKYFDSEVIMKGKMQHLTENQKTELHFKLLTLIHGFSEMHCDQSVSYERKLEILVQSVEYYVKTI